MSKVPKLLPDQHHIEQIRKKLWEHNEYGSVSVMIGSGFSMNAEKVTEGLPTFPILWELIGRMKNELYPSNTINTTSSDPLKLASEYELVFGRQALDDFIIRNVPDQNFVPGALHKLLLSLPWSDVFTTNYDTLLERTRSFVHDRKYELVLSPADLPHRMKPRIVKLHGSFPSQRPFIITEDDFRTYPRKFAAFVNTVQQSIMENALCLVGFSGDDSDFLQWIGWVRDNLGYNTPPIYFCGFPSDTQKRILQTRGITTIDLAPLFSNSEYLGNDRHQKALTWFMHNLLNGRQPNPNLWPNPLQTESKDASFPELPFIPSGPAPYVDLGLHHSPNQITYDNLVEILELWKRKREEYPGWLVAPRGSRRIIWEYTEDWIIPILNNVEKLSPIQSILLIYELNWRMETALTPLYNDLVHIIIPILQKINPFPEIIEFDEGQIYPGILVGNQNETIINWVDIRSYWVELAFAISRYARENMDEVLFNESIQKLKPIVQLNVQWNARWYMEQSMNFLYRHEQKHLQSTVEKWPETKDYPVWELRRAAILAELGEHHEALKISEAALVTLRLQMAGAQRSPNLLSQEGWALVLIEFLTGNRSSFQDRWIKLAQFNIHPRHELALLESSIKGTSIEIRSRTTVKKAFDPGVQTISSHFDSGDKPAQEALSFLRLLEVVGLPIKTSSTTMFRDAIIKATNLIKPYFPMRALSTLLRTEKEDEILNLFDRVTLASLPIENFEQLYHFFVPRIHEAYSVLVNEREHNNFAARKLVTYIEIISRICIRLTSANLLELLDFAIIMYKQHKVQVSTSLSGKLQHLFSRIFDSMSDQDKIDMIPKLLELYVAGDKGFEELNSDWVEPFLVFNVKLKVQDNYDRSLWNDSISNLIRLVTSGNTEARSRAALRLQRLYLMTGLSKEDTYAYAIALWSRRDELSGLPSETYFYKFAFLSLPYPIGTEPKQLLRKFLVTTEIPLVFKKEIDEQKRNSVSYSGGDNFSTFFSDWLNCSVLATDKVENEYKNIYWTLEEINQLIEKLHTWWLTQREYFKSSFGSFFGDPKRQLTILVSLLGQVVLMRIDRKRSDKLKNLLFEILDIFPDTVFALPMCVHNGILEENEVYDRLLKSLNSSDKNEVDSAVVGMFVWYIASSRGRIPFPKLTILDDLVNIIYFQSNKGLTKALREFAYIVDELTPSSIEQKYLKKLLLRLDMLLEQTDLSKGIDKSEIALDDVPELRSAAVQLASALYRRFQLTGEVIPETLQKWKLASERDHLPEVRNMWYELSDDELFLKSNQLRKLSSNRFGFKRVKKSIKRNRVSISTRANRKHKNRERTHKN